MVCGFCIYYTKTTSKLTDSPFASKFQDSYWPLHLYFLAGFVRSVQKTSAVQMMQLQSSCLKTKFGVVKYENVLRTRSKVTPTKMQLFEGLKKLTKRGPAKEEKTMETIIPAPSYNIPIACALISGIGVYEKIDAVAWLFGILGVFLAIQASRVKFIFGPQTLEVAIGKSEEELEKTENVFVGGENIWKYDTFTNWEFWWPNFPVLVYFKETQTKPEGQIHFFPLILNGKQVYDVMVERCGNSQNSLPSKET
eukprot:TRINITY_DN40037_c0_g1_i4.p1 TRINITY_DN40037_c0_g1~~TRINITY_DN40037_c0_g1_i4.p1  ORF type:complete len:252 (+),score=20.10 TRINITY_DN40037_c0_g1_i4:1-756(+)